MTTQKRFSIPNELHPNRRATLKAIHECAHCGYTGDFAFCPYCGKKRVCPSADPEEGVENGASKEPDEGDPTKLG